MDIERLLSAADDETTDIIESGVIDTDSDVIQEAGINHDVINSDLIGEVIDADVMNEDSAMSGGDLDKTIIDNSVIDNAIDEVINDDSEDDESSDSIIQEDFSQLNSQPQPQAASRIQPTKSNWNTNMANSNLQSLLAGQYHVEMNDYK